MYFACVTVRLRKGCQHGLQIKSNRLYIVLAHCFDSVDSICLFILVNY